MRGKGLTRAMSNATMSAHIVICVGKSSMDRHAKTKVTTEENGRYKVPWQAGVVHT